MKKVLLLLSILLSFTSFAQIKFPVGLSGTIQWFKGGVQVDEGIKLSQIGATLSPGDTVLMYVTEDSVIRFINKSDLSNGGGGSAFDTTTVYQTIADTAEVLRGDMIDSLIPVDVVVMRGQSNLLGATEAGQARLEDLAFAPYNRQKFNWFDTIRRVFIQDDYGGYEPLLLGYNNKAQNGDGFGPEAGYAQKWVVDHPTGYLFINKSPIDGAWIQAFLKGTTYYTDELAKQDSSARWLADRGFKPKIVCFLWNQGESNKFDTEELYLSLLDSLFDSYLEDGVISPDTRIVISNLKPTSYSYGAGVRAAQESFVAQRVMAVIQDNTYNYLSPDSVHYNTAGQINIGWATEALAYNTEIKTINDTVNRYILNNNEFAQPATIRLQNEIFTQSMICVGCNDSAIPPVDNYFADAGSQVYIKGYETLEFPKVVFDYGENTDFANKAILGLESYYVTLLLGKSAAGFQIRDSSFNRLFQVLDTGTKCTRLVPFSTGTAKYAVFDNDNFLKYVTSIPQSGVTNLTTSLAAKIPYFDTTSLIPTKSFLSINYLAKADTASLLVTRSFAASTYVPYTGATATLDLGSQVLKSNGFIATGAITPNSAGTGDMVMKATTAIRSAVVNGAYESSILLADGVADFTITYPQIGRFYIKQGTATTPVTRAKFETSGAFRLGASTQAINQGPNDFLGSYGSGINYSKFGVALSPTNGGYVAPFDASGDFEIMNIGAGHKIKMWDKTTTFFNLDISTGNVNIGNGMATASEKLQVNGNIQLGSVKIIVGSGSPESSVTAPVGSIYLRTDGGSGTSLYSKESGTGNTGWVGK